MSCFITGPKLFCRCNTVISGCIRRPGRLDWPSLSAAVPLTRILHQSVSSRIANKVKNNNTFAGKIRKSSCKSQPIFISPLRGIATHTVHMKYGKSKLHSTETNSRPEKRRRGLSVILQIAKVICLITGISVWVILLVVVFLVDDLEMKTVSREGHAMILAEIVRSTCFLGMTDAEQYFTRGSYSDQADLNFGDIDKIKFEIAEKINAFRDLWVRLRNEEGIQYSVGDPVDMCGYKLCKDREKIVPWNITKDEGKTKWIVNCYIEGSQGLALLCVLFERHDTESEWVATKLHIEKIKESGEVICNLSSSLPDGLKQLSCLADAGTDQVI